MTNYSSRADVKYVCRSSMKFPIMSGGDMQKYLLVAFFRGCTALTSDLFQIGIDDDETRSNNEVLMLSILGLR